MMSPQKVNIIDEHAVCIKCKAKIFDDFKFTGKMILEPTFREELCVCGNCEAEFIIHYDLFDKNGHIEPRIFTGDVNDPKYNWQDSLSDEQKKVIAIHLRGCEECKNRLADEILTDALFASLIHGERNGIPDRDDAKDQL